ncbi:MAG: ribonuclease P protein component [Sulfurimonas sp.]
MVSLGEFDIVKLHKEFRYIYNKGKNQHSKSVVLFYIPHKGVRKVGFTATKKIGNAVQRNRAKRRMRALFREFSPQLQEGSYIFVAKAAILTTPYKNLQYEFQKVLTRAKTLT